MKKNILLTIGLITLLILICNSMLNAQVSNWRGGSSQSQPQRSTQSIQQSVPQRNDMSSWRTQPERNNDRSQQNRRGSNIIAGDPFFNDWGWGLNRWNMWGAPAFGWNYFSPGWYMNDWGYRQPERIYVYDNGRQDTIRGKKPVISFGIQRTTDKQIGGFFTIGNKGYFILEYNSSIERDNSTFFPYGNIAQIDFPLVNDLVQRNSFYVGVGKRIKRTGVHFMIGTISEDVKWRGKDDIGLITFPKYLDRFTTLKIGALHDYKNFTIKGDYDPTIKTGTFGLGINF